MKKRKIKKHLIEAIGWRDWYSLHGPESEFLNWDLMVDLLRCELKLKRKKRG